MINPRVICSSITFRRRPLAEALTLIEEIGFSGFDLGALPGVCDHVPYELTPSAVEVAAVGRPPSATASINGDIGDPNWVLSDAEQDERDKHPATARLASRPARRRWSCPAVRWDTS